jgi:hypothetical protein
LGGNREEKERWLENFLAQHGATSGTIHRFRDGGLRPAATVNLPLPVQRLVVRVPSRKRTAGLALEAASLSLPAIRMWMTLPATCARRSASLLWRNATSPGPTWRGSRAPHPLCPGELNEDASISLDAEVFNLLNHTELNFPERYADQPSTFGKIFSSKPPRLVQFALPFTF